MNYLDYFLKNDTIRPSYLFKDKEFKGGYLKPDWMRLLRQEIKYFKNGIEKYKTIDKAYPVKNNKITSNITAPSISDTFKLVTNGLVLDGFPRSEWSVSNFTGTPVKGS